MLYMPRSGLACHVCRTALSAAMLIAMAAAWCGGALATFDVKKIESLGARGLMPAFKITCEDHEGGGAVRLMQPAPPAATAKSQQSVGDERSMRRRVAGSDARTRTHCAAQV